MYAFGMSGSDWSRALAVAAFVGSYAALGLGRVPGFRVDRTGVAIIGATAMVVSGVIGWDEAVASVVSFTTKDNDGPRRQVLLKTILQGFDHAHAGIFHEQDGGDGKL